MNTAAWTGTENIQDHLGRYKLTDWVLQHPTEYPKYLHIAMGMPRIQQMAVFDSYRKLILENVKQELDYQI